MGNLNLDNRQMLLNNVGILIFRVGLSILMIWEHGIGKLSQLFSGEEIKFADPIGLGVITSFVLATFAEFVCQILILFGLYTRLASLILVVNMTVATYVLASGDSSPQLPLLYLLGYLLLFFSAGGRFSLDFILRKKQ